MKMLRTLAIAALMAVIGRPALAAVTLPTTLTNEIQQIPVPRNPQFILFGRSPSGGDAINFCTIDAQGRLLVGVANGVTVFSTTITVTNTGGASAVFANNWPGWFSWSNTGGASNGTVPLFTTRTATSGQMGSTSFLDNAALGGNVAGTTTYTMSNPTSSASLLSYSIGVGNNGGGTIVVEGTALDASITYLYASPSTTVTVVIVSGNGGSETAVVYPSGVTSAQWQFQRPLVASCSFYVGSTTQFVEIGTFSGLVKTNLVAVTMGGMVQQWNDPFLSGSLGFPIPYSSTGSTRYAISGDATPVVMTITFTQIPLLCVSNVSMAQAAAGQGFTIQPGQRLDLTGPQSVFKGGTATTWYVAVLNNLAAGAPVQVAVVKPQIATN